MPGLVTLRVCLYSGLDRLICRRVNRKYFVQKLDLLIVVHVQLSEDGLEKHAAYGKA